MLSGFDYGKGLSKQLESFKRLPPLRQQGRLPAMQRQLETYANNYLYNVLTHPSVKPGMLKSGAETLVEASKALGSTSSAYRVFSELAARSRKVEAVPGLSHIADRLLELPTDQKKERAALLTWRIVAGNLPVLRQVKYMADRAHLTNTSSDWRDYASGVAAMVRKGDIAATDESLVDILNDLIANKESLGDLVYQAQRDLAEAMLQRKSYRQAESLLISAAVEAKDLPASFLTTVEKLLTSRPDSMWELHQVLLQPALTRFGKGELAWGELRELLERAALHAEPLARLLVERPELPGHPQLAGFTARLLSALSEEQKPTLSERVKQALSKAPVAGSGEPFLALRSAPEVSSRATPVDFDEHTAEAVPPVPELAQPTVQDTSEKGRPSKARPEPPRLLEQLHLVHDAVGLERALAACVDDPPTAQQVKSAVATLAASNLPGWAVLHGLLWTAGRMADPAAAATLLAAAEPARLQRGFQLNPDSEQAAMLVDLASIAKDEGNVALLRSLGEIAAAAGSPWVAMRVSEIAGDKPDVVAAIARKVEEQGVSSAEAGARNMIAHAAAQRAVAGGGPEAGFETAVRADLLAEEEVISERYDAWAAELPEEHVRRTRAAQAVYLCTRERNVERTLSALGEMQRVFEFEGAVPELKGWLQQLSPLLVHVPKDSLAETITAYVKLYQQTVSAGGDELELPDGVGQALTSLSVDQLDSVMQQIADTVDDVDRMKMECMLLQKRGDWRGAVDVVGAAYDELADPVVPLQLIGLMFKQLSDTDLLPAAKRLIEVLEDREDPDATMEVIRRIELKLESAAATVDPRELKHLMQTTLAHLTEIEYEPAIKFVRERSPRATGRPAGAGEEEVAGQKENGLVGDLLDFILEQLDRVDISGARR